MTDLIKQLEAWADAQGERFDNESWDDGGDGTSHRIGAKEMLDLLRPVIEAADTAHDPSLYDRPCDACDRNIKSATCTCFDYLAAVDELRKALADLRAKLEEK